MQGSVSSSQALVAELAALVRSQGARHPAVAYWAYVESLRGATQQDGAVGQSRHLFTRRGYDSL